MIAKIIKMIHISYERGFKNVVQDIAASVFDFIKILSLTLSKDGKQISAWHRSTVFVNLKLGMD